MSDDHCVYARNMLGRMMSSFTSVPNTEPFYSSSQSPTGTRTPLNMQPPT